MPMGSNLHIIINTGGVMFEHDQEIVNSLLSENNDFKRLYEKHNVLKNTVKDVNDKNLKVDQLSLEGLKKEKLILKDRMATIIEDYKHDHV
tara:strand:- start:97153 stop:97425 length:273 start_codon:yes stop_codon:yes gene_type:complete